MPLTCRPKRRHVLFSRRLAVAALRGAPSSGAFCGRSQTSSDRHDQQRRVASAPRFRQGRSRLRARRGRVAGRHQRRSLSRFHLGRRGQCARPLPSASGRSAAGAGHQALAHVEPVQVARRRQARRAAVRAELCRLRVLLQFRRRGDGMRDQGGAQVSRRQGPSRALSHHHLRRRVPRPHAGDAGRDRLRQISRRLRPADGRLRPGAAWRHRSGEEGDRPAHRRHPDRAGAGRGRRPLGAERVLQGVARTLRQAWPAAGVRRGADRHGPHRRSLCLQAPRRHPRRDVAGESARRRFSDRRVPRHRGSRVRHDAGLARLDLRRQSAGDRGGECRARRDAEARLLRSRAEDVAAAEAKARLGGRPLSERAVGSARRGPAGRRQGRGALGRSRQRAARPEAAHRRRRRQRRALPRALDRQ